MPRLWVAVAPAVVALAIASCGGEGGSPGTDGSWPPATLATEEDPDATGSARSWTEESFTFGVGSNELHGILTLPAGTGTHSAVVIASGSETPTGEIQSGVSDRYFVDLARRFADVGYAAFRYDTAGVGKSEGTTAPSLTEKRNEVLAALHRLQEHPAIQADDVGLWGGSQEAWVISMAAAAEPDDVAFIISVSGAGISPAEQQVWGIEVQSRAAGLTAADVQRATLFGGLLVDWQLSEPLFREVNQQIVAELGEGPWQDFHALVYDSSPSEPAALSRGIEILTSVQDEPWAQALHLEELYLPALRSIPPGQVEQLRAATEEMLVTDPSVHLTQVTCPVLAFWGEDDIVQPTERSAALYADYLDEAGNDDVTLLVLPGVDHDIGLSSPGYWDRLVEWLEMR